MRNKTYKLFTVAFLFVLAICLILGQSTSNVSAQQNSDGDLSSSPEMTGGIPQQAPPGWDQGDWDHRIEECKQIGAEVDRRAKLTVEERNAQPPLPYGAVQDCVRMMAPAAHEEPSEPASVSPFQPMPMATPSTPIQGSSQPAPAPTSDAQTPAPLATSNSSTVVTYSAGVVGGISDNSISQNLDNTCCNIHRCGTSRSVAPCSKGSSPESPPAPESSVL